MKKMNQFLKSDTVMILKGKLFHLSKNNLTLGTKYLLDFTKLSNTSSSTGVVAL